jgi:hypothetical protein
MSAHRRIDPPPLGTKYACACGAQGTYADIEWHITESTLHKTTEETTAAAPDPTRTRQAKERAMTIASMKEWLLSWGDGPNWSDPTGVTVPVAKESLRELLTHAERMRDALQQLRDRALTKAPAAVAEFSPATAASIAYICEDALEGVR